MKPHKQVFVKVNAHVDSQIAGLVSALSLFPKLETIESCQGSDQQSAWICFYYGNYWDHPWRDLATFIFEYLAPRLIRKVGDDVSIRIQVTPSSRILGELSVRPGATHRVERAIRLLAGRATAYQRRNLGYFDGRSDTKPRHY